jgi:hypothetical protein
MSIAGLAYFLAVCFWLATACYGVLASQAFIQEQFLTPKLFDPLAVFAERHALIGMILLGAWIGARIRRPNRPSPRWTSATAMVWLAATAWLTVAAPLAEPHTTEEALLIGGIAVTLLFLLAAAERPALDTRLGLARDRSRADLSACLLAAAIAFAAHSCASVWLEGQSAVSVSEMLQTLRLHLLMAAAVFLVLSAVRGAAGLTSRPVLAEFVLTVSVLGATLTAFVSMVFLASISIRGLLATAIALAIGSALACVIGVRAADADSVNDGVAKVCSVLSPNLTARWWGLVMWAVCLVGLAMSFATASRTADWSFVVLHSGIALIWLLSLAPAVTFSRRMADGGAGLSFAFVSAVLAVHLTLQGAVAPVHASSLRNASGKWLAEMLERDGLSEGSTDLVRLLHASTNIPRATPVAAVDVSLAELSGSPAPVRPHVFVLVVDSLRRDYLSPYNPAVTFTPRLEALARDSLVFRNAFTQYGATGLSIPSIWVGGPILHKQYVTSFPRMNTLGKLLAHEQYEQWIGMDHIMETVLAPSDRRAPLDAGTPVKEYRLCKTLGEIRARLSQRSADAPPVFAYSLPQDVHVSVINREGARSIDEADYSGFYAPVASRVRRLDQCLGAFIDDLKTKGLYERSVIVLTSDHGDSLGDEGRIGHAYSLHPEIVRVPLIVHVPPGLGLRGRGMNTAPPTPRTSRPPCTVCSVMKSRRRRPSSAPRWPHLRERGRRPEAPEWWPQATGPSTEPCSMTPRATTSSTRSPCGSWHLSLDRTSNTGRCRSQSSFRRAGGRPFATPSKPSDASTSSLRLSILGLDLVQRAFVVAPLGLHLHAQVEEDALLQVALQLDARACADPLDHGAAFPNHDRLLRFTVDQDCAVEFHTIAAGRFLEPVDDDGRREWQLVVRQLQHLLAHHFRDEKTLCLIRQIVGWIERFPVGKVLEKQSFENIDVGAVHGRRGHDFNEWMFLPVVIDERQQLLFGNEIDLVEHEYRRLRGFFQQVEHIPVTFPRLLRRVDDQREHIDFPHRLQRDVDHSHVEPVRRLVNARRVHEHDLPVRVVLDAHDACAGGLRLVRHDGELLTDNAVEQSRLAGVRPAEQRHEPGFHGRGGVRSNSRSRKSTTRSNGSKPKAAATDGRRFELALMS